MVLNKKIIVIWAISCVISGIISAGLTESRLNKEHKKEMTKLVDITKTLTFKYEDAELVHINEKLSLPAMTEFYYPKWHERGYIYVGNVPRGDTSHLTEEAENQMGRKIWSDGSNKTVIEFKIDEELNGRWRNGREDAQTFPTFVKVE